MSEGVSMKRVCRALTAFAVVAAAIFSFIISDVFGHEGCLENSKGAVICPPPMGGIAKNSLGEILCGKGQCMKTNSGSVQCSKQTGGYAYKDRLGRVVCTEGCEEGTEAMCQMPR
jgi:hypothetical protein